MPFDSRNILDKLLKALRQKFQEWERAEQGNSPELRESPTVYVLQTVADNPQA